MTYERDNPGDDLNNLLRKKGGRGARGAIKNMTGVGKNRAPDPQGWWGREQGKRQN